MASVRKATAGFTLLEVLIVLVILGLVVGGLTEGVRYGTRAWSAEARAAAAHQDMDATERALRQLIGHSGSSGIFHGVSFKGRADQLELATALPEAAALASRRVEAVIEVDSAKRLVMRWRPLRHETTFGPPPPPADEVLLTGVDGIAFSYHSRSSDPVRSPGEWRHDWSEAVPPDLVRVHIEFGAGDARHWPDLVIARLTD